MPLRYNGDNYVELVNGLVKLIESRVQAMANCYGYMINNYRNAISKK